MKLQANKRRDIQFAIGD